MNTSEFINLLEVHGDRMLQFEYRPGRRLQPDYHITEVKNVHIDATDCGGRTDSWKETVIQLWEADASPAKVEVLNTGAGCEGPAEKSISTRKALAILGRVNRAQPLHQDTVLKFEYGNPGFHTAQLQVGSHSLEEGKLVVHLVPDGTQCKASDFCAVPRPANSEAGACSPGSGCC